MLPPATSISSLTARSARPARPIVAAPAASAAAAPAVTSATPPGSVPTFTLSGCATSQPTVALTLERLRLMDGVKEVTLQSSTAGSGGTSAASGGCPGRDPAFTALVTFDPLPSASAVAAVTKAKVVSDSPSSGSASSTTTTTPRGAR